MKNPEAPAVKREAEEDWGNSRDGLQMNEPRRIRRVLPGEPDCELVFRYAAVESENSVGVEQEVGIGSTNGVSHLSRGGKAADGVILADEGEGVQEISGAAEGCRVGID